MKNTNEKPIGWPIELAVFVCGAVVMTYEIVGSRILAPYIGTSTYIWTGLIGVILGALSLGYWLGGRIADRRPNVGVLASAIFVSGGLISVTILIKDIALSAIATTPVNDEVRSIVAALVLFAPASVALGFVIPYATKLRIADLAETGSAVGRLYALSTIGSIVGTFSAGFFFIPFVGSVRTLYLLAATLLLMGGYLGGVSIVRRWLSVVAIFATGLLTSEGYTYLLRSTNLIADIDTQYSRVRVFEATETSTGRKLIALATDPTYIQSARYIDSIELALDYTKYYDLVGYFVPGLQRVLMIGGAGYSYPQVFLRNFPDSHIDVAEIDPGMTVAARQYFGLIDDPRMTIIHRDGRMVLNSARDGEYNAILMDAFGSLFSVPFQLTTIEAVRKMRRAIAEDGVVIFNLGSALSGPSALFFRSQLATYRQVFAEVQVYKVRPEAADNVQQNLIIVACKQSCRNDKSFPTNSNIEFEGLLSTKTDPGEVFDVQILTDELAPVERFASIANSLR
ncbi:fused MFS/spermidine synthase [Leptolyngbya sp. 7M]|uniref:fused MFS/spermidine synthase n=1 Tax=Leptolyngbya sp. 7M TaxID=2812896 RepID=UPI001B8B1D49|nr:fused MFS/spermidine synthase [Leptolyngbya sp. 7M]QYO67686.1 fused MFS/spermidine synthase [Leptolyngbya sp. 7M]